MPASAGPLRRWSSTDSKEIEQSIIRCLICGVNSSDNVSTAELIQKLDIFDLGAAISSRHLWWFGDVKRSNMWTARVSAPDVDGQILRGRPSKTWVGVIKSDL